MPIQRSTLWTWLRHPGIGTTYLIEAEVELLELRVRGRNDDPGLLTVIISQSTARVVDITRRVKTVAEHMWSGHSNFRESSL